MMHILFDVNIILDICARRKPFFQLACDSLEKCFADGCSPWIYTGSVQTLEFTLASELVRLKELDGCSLTRSMSLQIARKLLAIFSSKMNWLAALANEGDVFGADDPEDEQLIRALDRFPAGEIKLLTRDHRLLNSYPDKAISPEQYCQLPPEECKLPFIDLNAQQDQIRPELEKNMHRVLHHGRYILGSEVQELERRLCEYTGAKHCIGVSSGTDALLMPLMAWDIGPGDAVFTTPFTFIATAEVIRLIGATPVFVDIDPQTFNIDPKKLELAIRAVHDNAPEIYPLPRKPEGISRLVPKTIIPVDLFGLPADYDPITSIAEDYGLKVLADSAQGFGSQYKGRKSGTLGHATATSFFPAKPLGAYGDGGAIFTDDDELAETLESIRVHGKGKDKYDNVRIGLNARLDTLQAAVLLAKLDIFDKELEAKKEVAEQYTGLVADKTARISPPYIPQGFTSAWAQYSVLAETGKQRGDIQAALRKAGVPSMVYYPKPLHMQTAFGQLGYLPEDMPVAMDTARRILSLPMHAYLQDEQIVAIVETLRQSH